MIRLRDARICKPYESTGQIFTLLAIHYRCLIEGSGPDCVVDT